MKEELSPGIRRKAKKNSRSPYRARLGYGWFDPYMPWESVQASGQQGQVDQGDGAPSGDSGGDSGSGDAGAGDGDGGL